MAASVARLDRAGTVCRLLARLMEPDDRGATASHSPTGGPARGWGPNGTGERRARQEVGTARTSQRTNWSKCVILLASRRPQALMRIEWTGDFIAATAAYTAFDMLRPASRAASQIQLLEKMWDDPYVKSFRMFEKWSTEVLSSGRGVFSSDDEGTHVG